jgi:hypothetical protein
MISLRKCYLKFCTISRCYTIQDNQNKKTRFCENKLLCLLIAGPEKKGKAEGGAVAVVLADDRRQYLLVIPQTNSSILRLGDATLQPCCC